MAKEKEYFTSDFYLAAFLHTRGYYLDRVETMKQRNNKGKLKGVFVFTNVNGLEDDANLFKENEKVNVQDFIAGLRAVRERLYLALDNANETLDKQV